MSASLIKNESVQKSIDEETSSSSSPPQLKTTSSSNNGNNGAGEKMSQKKSRKNHRSKKSTPSMAKSYEHHLEKWLENSSNFIVGGGGGGENNMKEGWPFVGAANAALPQPKQQQQQQKRPANRRKDQTQQHHQPFDVVNDAILFNKSFDGGAQQQINNFKTYPWQQQQQRSDSPTTNEQLSLSTQPDFVSLSMLKNGKSESEDQDKVDESSASKLNELMINEMRKIHKKKSNKNQSNLDTSSDDDDDDDEEDEADEEEEELKKSEVETNDFMDLNNKTVLVALLKQINRLHETNTKIFRNLHDTKVELEALKHSPSIGGLRHRRESFNSNTPSLHSQQFNIPAAPSPAPSFHSMASSHYPGVVTDMIREIRESMKNREDSMMSRVKTIVDEKTWTSSDLNMRLLREFEDLKVQLHNMKLDRLTTNDRMMKLEEEVRSLKSAFLRSGVGGGGGSGNASMNSSFHQYAQYPSPSSAALNVDQMKRSSIMSLENNFDDNFYLKRFYPQSPPRRHDNNSMNEDDEFDKSHLVQMEKDTLKLRRDLQDAIASKAQAEQKILALENLVTNLSSHPSNPSSYNNNNHHHNNHDDQNSMSDRTHHQIQVPQGGSNGPPLTSNTTQLKHGAIQVRITSQSDSSEKSQTTGKIITPKAVKASQVTLSSSTTSLPVTDL